MKALVLKEYRKFSYEDVPIPQFGPKDVLVAVKACGICGSDVHGMDGSTGRRRPPIIMGHEAAGVIAEAGAGVKGWTQGQRVTFDSTVYCGACEFCRARSTPFNLFLKLLVVAIDQLFQASLLNSRVFPGSEYVNILSGAGYRAPPACPPTYPPSLQRLVDWKNSIALNRFVRYYHTRRIRYARSREQHRGIGKSVSRPIWGGFCGCPRAGSCVRK